MRAAARRASRRSTVCSSPAAQMASGALDVLRDARHVGARTTSAWSPSTTTTSPQSSSPPLTTIEQPSVEQGRRMVDVLLHLIDGGTRVAGHDDADTGDRARLRVDPRGRLSTGRPTCRPVPDRTGTLPHPAHRPGVACSPCSPRRPRRGRRARSNDGEPAPRSRTRCGSRSGCCPSSSHRATRRALMDRRRLRRPRLLDSGTTGRAARDRRDGVERAGCKRRRVRRIASKDDGSGSRRPRTQPLRARARRGGDRQGAVPARPTA